MDKDLVLTKLFEEMAKNKQVGKFINQGAEYYVCPVAAMQREPLAKDAAIMKPGVMYPYASDMETYDVTDFKRFNPEVALEYDFLPIKEKALSDKRLFLLPVKSPPIGKAGFWLLEMFPDEGYFKYIKTVPFGNTRFLKEANMVAYSVPAAIINILDVLNMTLSDVDGCLMVSKLSHHLSIGMTGDTAFLYAAMAGLPVHNAAYKTIVIDNSVYTCDGLEEFEVLGSTGSRVSQRFTSVIKKKGHDMMKLVNPVPGKKAGIESEMADTPAAELIEAASPNDSEINKAVNAPVIPAAPEKKAGLRAQLGAVNDVPAAQLSDTITAEEYQERHEQCTTEEEPQKEAVEEPAKEETKQETVETAEAPQTVKEADKPKAKRRTKQATATGGFDFDAVIAYLGSPVQPVGPGDIESALAEIRSLRDVQINAARRAANITSEICKASVSGLQTLAELQAILRK